MLFFPFRVDLNFNRIPLLTILFCLIAIYIFIQQGVSAENIESSSKQFCELKHDRTFWFVIKKVSMVDRSKTAGNKNINELYKNDCEEVFYNIHTSKYPDMVIDEYVDRLDSDAIRNDAINSIYIRGMLEEKYREFKLSGVDNDLTAQLMYEPHSYNLINMVTAVFAHASWEHLLGNLFFFFAFAASIEIILGMLRYVLIFVSLAIGTHLSYSLAMMNINDALPTLGLSGVVMGMIGVFVFLMPKINIRCFLWFFIIFRIVTVPAWLLAAWYVSWDIYALYNSDGQSAINFIAHISGAILGFGLGLLFLVEQKEQIEKEIMLHYEAEEQRQEEL